MRQGELELREKTLQLKVWRVNFPDFAFQTRVLLPFYLPFSLDWKIHGGEEKINSRLRYKRTNRINLRVWPEGFCLCMRQMVPPLLLSAPICLFLCPCTTASPYLCLFVLLSWPDVCTSILKAFMWLHPAKRPVVMFTNSTIDILVRIIHHDQHHFR